MKHAIFSVLLSSSLLAQVYTEENEGSKLAKYEGGGESDYVFSWYARAGRTYFVETTDDLASGVWSCLPERVFGKEAAEQFGVTIDVPSRFYRLRYVEGLSYIGKSQCDLDHDGVSDDNERTAGTHPLRNLDSDANDLPDDWEQYNFGIIGNDPDSLHPSSGGLTKYQAWRKDWVRGAHITYGGHAFTFESFDSTVPLVVYMNSDQDGGLKAIYTDSTYSTISSLVICPSIKSDAFTDSDPSRLTKAHKSIYTLITDSDPARQGYTFTEVKGKNAEVRWDEETQEWITEFVDNNFFGRDLLRSIDTTEIKAGSARPNGNTKPTPYKRSIISLSGSGSEMRRVASAAAITSLPLTRVSNTFTSAIVRDFPHESPAFPDFEYDWMNRQTGTDNSMVKADLTRPSPWGLPAYAQPPGYSTKYARSATSFAPWYQSNNALTLGIVPVNPNFSPSDDPNNTSYSYGYYMDPYLENVPHANDVGFIWDFTLEAHLKLDYDSSTKFYVKCDDDVFIFVNGKRAVSLGGIHSVTTPAIVDFNLIRTSVGLSGSSGTCTLDIFYAERQSSGLDFKFLSTTPLRPVYCYQVVSDTANLGSVRYAFAEDPITHSKLAPSDMEIDPATGKIAWDFHARTTAILPPSNFNITVNILDEQDNILDQQSFTITVE